MQGTQQTKEVDVTALLKTAGTVPAGAELVEFNPLDNTPAVRVGKEWLPGQTITGRFEGSKLVSSEKLKFGDSMVHALRLASDDRIGIWGTGELDLAFRSLPIGTLISIKYIGKQANPRDASMTQHMFEYRRGTAN